MIGEISAGLSISPLFSRGAGLDGSIGEIGFGDGAKPPSFSAVDQNDDGGLSFSEVSAVAPGGADAEPIFNAIDADGDGSITEAEQSAFQNAMREQLAEMFDMAQGGDGRRDDGQGGVTPDGGADLVSMLLDAMGSEDADSDDETSEDEAGAVNDVERLAQKWAEQAYVRTAEITG